MEFIPKGLPGFVIYVCSGLLKPYSAAISIAD